MPSEASAPTVMPFAGIVAGALYRPAVVMVPFCALPPFTPDTDQVTAVLLSPVTVAAYCTVPLTPMVV